MTDGALRKARRTFILRSLLVLLLIVVLLILPLFRFEPDFSVQYDLAMAKSGVVYRSSRFVEAAPEGIPYPTKTLNGKYRYTVDRNGKNTVLTDAVFDDARTASLFFMKNEGKTVWLAAVASGSKWGFIFWDDLEKGSWKWLVEPVYDNAEPFCGGIATVEIGGNYGWVDHTGKPLTELQYQDVRYYSHGLIPVQDGVVWYYMDLDGRKRLGPYEGAESFAEGLACVKQGGVWGYIDTDGNWVKEPLYEDAWEVSGGKAFILQNGQWHEITVKVK